MPRPIKLLAFCALLAALAGCHHVNPISQEEMPRGSFGVEEDKMTWTHPLAKTARS